MINLLVVDLHSVDRCGFKTFLNGCDFVNIVKCLENIEQAMEIVDNHQIDILITET
jgi:DNA-binding NarL/FixJ family response regulator